MKFNPMIKWFVVISSSFLLTGCLSIFSSDTEKDKEEKDSAPTGVVDWGRVKEVTPKPEPRSRYGNPKYYDQSGKRYYLLPTSENYSKKGKASWYGTKFHGRRTSSGETYDMFKMTAAHKTLPIPCYAKVTNLDNGKHVIVKINDRGPFKSGRIIDLSYAAAHKLDMAKAGIANVKVETISFNKGSSKNTSTKSPSTKKRFVQVGAYSSLANARNLAKVLDKEIRLPVKVSSVKRGGKKLYRVRVGPIPSESVAKELVRTLDIKELGKPKIVYQ